MVDFGEELRTGRYQKNGLETELGIAVFGRLLVILRGKSAILLAAMSYSSLRSCAVLLAIVHLSFLSSFVLAQTIDSSEEIVVTDQWAYEVIYLGHWELLTKPVKLRHLIGRSPEELRIIRNTPFARHGYRFSSEDLHAHFHQFSWYASETKNVELIEVENDNVHLIRSIEQNHASRDLAELYRALSLGEAESFETSVFKKVDFNFIDTTAETTPLLEAIRSGNADSVEYLLSNGANPDLRASILGTGAFESDGVPEIHRDEDGELVAVWVPWVEKRYSASIPLVLAVLLDNPLIVELLFEYGADPELYLAEWEAPILVMLSTESNTHLELFLKAGADPNREGTYDSPLTAANDSWVVTLLLRYGADPLDIVDGTGYSAIGASTSAEQTKILIDAVEGSLTAERQIANEYTQDSILHVLVRRYKESGGSEKALWRANIERMVAIGADPSLQNRNGVNAFDFARSEGLTDLLEILE